MYQRYIKRSADITLALFVILILSPIYIIVSFLVIILSPGPILFRQTRTGQYGKEFTMYKFRTMNHKNDVHDHTKENELTKIGKIIRSLSLDELPQVINILKGEMSFIGPRPWIVQYYHHMNKVQRNRTAVKPGITGLAQVHGRNSLTIFEKIEYDLGYVRRIGLREDIKIIFLTVKTIFDQGSKEIAKIGIHKELHFLKNQKEYMEE